MSEENGGYSSGQFTVRRSACKKRENGDYFVVIVFALNTVGVDHDAAPEKVNTLTHTRLATGNV